MLLFSANSRGNRYKRRDTRNACILRQQRHAAMSLVIGEAAIRGLELYPQPGRVPWEAQEIYAACDQLATSPVRIGNYPKIFLVCNGPCTGSIGVYLWKTYKQNNEEHACDLETPKFFIFGWWKTCLAQYYFVPSESMRYTAADGNPSTLTEEKMFAEAVLDRISKYEYIVSEVEGGEHTHRVDTHGHLAFWLRITSDAKKCALFCPDVGAK